MNIENYLESHPLATMRWSSIIYNALIQENNDIRKTEKIDFTPYEMVRQLETPLQLKLI